MLFCEWIQRLYRTLSDTSIWPVLLHCTGGKDRTGVAVALLLKNIGIPDTTIIAEYSLSQGNIYPDNIGDMLAEVPKAEHLAASSTQLASLRSLLLHKR